MEQFFDTDSSPKQNEDYIKLKKLHENITSFKYLELSPQETYPPSILIWGLPNFVEDQGNKSYKHKLHYDVLCPVKEKKRDKFPRKKGK